ncbi:MAG: TolC family protein [Saprospiraceae bacterium]|nr:TolC family protein [Saprospiraceae bacterium]
MKPTFVHLFLVLAFWLGCLPAFSQEGLSLSECFQLVERQHPIAQQVAIQSAISEARLDQLNRNYWPKLEVQGQATWQNEVTVVDVPIPGFETPTAPKDQYRIVGELTQTLYDGGTTRHLKAASRAEQGGDQLQTEADLYQLKFQVNQLYFGILLTQEHRKALELVQQELQRREGQLADLYTGGIVQRNDIDLLAVELIKHRQSLEQNRLQEELLRANLGQLIGREIPLGTPFTLPNQAETSDQPRREWALFDAKEAALEAQAKLIQSQQLPKLSIFAQGGLGRPGFNLFNPDPAPLFMAGARLRWNLSSFYSNQPDRELIRLNREMVGQQEAGFRQALDIQVRQAKNDSNTYSAFLETDRDILERRTRIKDTAAIQLEEGIIPTPDYLREVDAWHQASLQYEVHRIQAIQSTIEARLIAGKKQKN